MHQPVSSHPRSDSANALVSSPEIVRMQYSSHRKAFIFLAIFDLLLMLVVWLLIAAVQGFIKSLSLSDLVNYTKSLFDLVILGFCRSFLIILVYWILRLTGRWTMLFISGASTVYLIVKCFYFDFLSEREDYLDVFFVVASLVIVWVEYGFYELKVLPAFYLSHLNEESEERRRLLPERLPERKRTRANNSDPDTSFHTPRGSPTSFEETREDELGIVSQIPNASEVLAEEKILQYVELAKDALRFCILTSTDRSSPWRVEKAEGGFVCEGLSRRKQPKLFRCSGIINCSPDDVFRILHIEGDKQPLWNPTVLKSQSLYKIGEDSDIAYNVATEAAGGLIASRDFVTARHWEKQGPNYVAAGVGIDFPEKPAVEGIIRGLNGPGGYVINALPNDLSKSRLMWILDTDLKGWIPQYIIDKSLSTVMVTFFQKLNVYVSQLRRQNRLLL